MTHTTTVLTAAAALLIASPAIASPAADASLDGNADQCFAAANRAAAGDESAELSTASCRRALRHEPISRADRSAMLHNRGIIELALGDLRAARASFARAVRLSVTVDERNLALAQVAHRLGDYELAVQQYDLWIEHAQEAQDAEIRERTLENRRHAARFATAANVAQRR